MKRILSSAVLLALTGSQAMGGGNIALVEPIVAEKDTGEVW